MSSVIHQLEMDMVTSVLADPVQFQEVKDIHPEQLSDPTAKALWSVIHASGGNVTATSLYHELDTFEQGRQVIQQYPTIEGFRSLWSQGSVAGAADISAGKLREENIRLQINHIVEHRNTFLSPAESAQDMARQLMRISYYGEVESNADQLIQAGNSVITEILWKIANPGKGIGWKCGDSQYDAFLQEIGGLLGEKLIVTAALTNKGKTQWLLNQALGYSRNIRDDNGKYARVAYVSTEMGIKSIAKRCMSHLGELSLNTISPDPDFELKVKQAQLKWNELVETGRFIVIPDVLQIDTIVRKLGQMRMKDQIDIAIIDYIGMIQGSKGSNDKASSYTAVGEVVKTMQSTARELDMPVITAAQLNRDTYNNPGGKPEMSNIAESSIINNCANAVHMIWRPDIESKYVSGSGVGIWQDVVQFLTPKVRDAATHKPMFYHFNGRFAMFKEVPAKMRTQLMSEEEQRRIMGGK